MSAGKTTLIYAAAFLVATAVALVNLGMVFFARDFHGASPSAIGWIAGLGSVSYALGCLLVQPLFRAALPQHLIVAATVGAGLSAVAMLYAPSVPFLCAAMTGSGISLSFFWPPLMGWLSAGSEGRRLNVLLSRFSVAWSAGIVIGPYLCGSLSERSSRIPLQLAGALYAVTAVMLVVAYALLPGLREAGQTREHGPAVAPATPRTRMRYPARVGLVATFVAIGAIVTVFPMAGRERLAFSTTAIGVALLVRALTNAAGFCLLGLTSRWHFRLRPLLFGQAATAVVMAGLALTGNYTLIVALIGLTGLTGALAYVESVFHGVSGSADRPLRMALHEALLALGSMVGSVAGGAIYERTDLGTVYWLCAATLLAVVPVQILLRGPAEESLRKNRAMG